ncbi:unnamed protein product [Leptosia nina]|uniref:Uncharacterized protein n=1 Tax=Leptosia nina TaxID=320188 RepID=A0AAV1JNT6_9NEOP
MLIAGRGQTASAATRSDNYRGGQLSSQTIISLKGRRAAMAPTSGASIQDTRFEEASLRVIGKSSQREAPRRGCNSTRGRDD